MLPQGAQAAHADLSVDTYQLTVEGDGMSMNVVDQALPFTSSYTISPYSALSQLDSTGLSTAQAGAPYPGFFGPLYRNVNGLIYGEVPPLPPLPGNAESNYPAVPSAKETTAAGYTLSAESALDHSTALVNLGSADAQRGVSFASALTTAASSGVVTGIGSAGIRLLNIENVATIADVSSIASMEMNGSGPPVVKTQTNLGSITVSGYPVAVTPDGVTVTGTNLPVPVNQANEQVNQALSSSGITMRLLPATTQYVPGTKIVKAVTSGALQITMLADIPTQGPTTFDLVLGRVVVTGTDSGGSAGATPSATAGSPTATTKAVAGAGRMSTVGDMASRGSRLADGHEEA
jgi:hypothetical protein